MDDKVTTKHPMGRDGLNYTQPTPVKTRRRRPVAGLILGLLIIAVVGYGAYRVFFPAEKKLAVGTSKASSPPQPVGVATIEQGDIRVILRELGTVTPLANVTVKTQINGQLIDVGFKEGQYVKKGDFLAQIDPRPYQILQQQYEGQMQRDQALLDQARFDLTRYQTLLQQNSIARQQAEDQVFLVKQYEGAVRTDQGLIDNQKLNVSYCRIVAPVSGRVGLRQVDPGNYVQTTDSGGLVILTQIDPISVVFSVAEDDLPQVVAQMRDGATMDAMAFDRSNVTQLGVGHVTTLDNQIDTSTGTVRIRALFENAAEHLFPNQFVNVQLVVRSLPDVVIAPNAGIQRGALGTYVYVVTPENKVQARPVKLGVSDGGSVVIEAGLSLGERIVVDGTDRLRDGAKVVIPGENSEGGGKSGKGKKADAPAAGGDDQKAKQKKPK